MSFGIRLYNAAESIDRQLQLMMAEIDGGEPDLRAIRRTLGVLRKAELRELELLARELVEAGAQTAGARG